MPESTISDIKTVLEHPEQIVHPPKKRVKGHYRDGERVNKLRSDAKWDSRLAEMAIKLLAGGATYDDVGYLLGVAGQTIADWRAKYPDFKAASDAGHTAANARTLGEMLRCAWGYEYTEKTIKRNVTLDKNGEELPSEDGNKAVVTEHFKIQPPNADLLKFIALNRLSDEFKDTKRIEIDENRNITISGQLESDAIDLFIQKFLESAKQTKQIENKIVGQPIDATFGDTQGDLAKPGIQEATPQLAG